MTYPCIYLVQRGVQRKIGRTVDPYRRLLREHGTYFPKSESNCILFPVICDVYSETQLKRWLREKNYTSEGSEMLRADISTEQVEEIIDRMNELMRKDYPTGSCIECRLVDLESRLSSAPLQQRKTITREMVEEITRLYEKSMNDWNIIENIPVLSEESIPVNIDGRYIHVNNSCHHCNKKINRTSITLLWLDGLLDETLIQFGSTCIKTIQGIDVFNVKHTYPPEETKYVFLMRELRKMGMNLDAVNIITTKLREISIPTLDHIIQMENPEKLSKIIDSPIISRLSQYSDDSVDILFSIIKRVPENDIDSVLKIVSKVDDRSIAIIDNRLKLLSNEALATIGKFPESINVLSRHTDSSLEKMMYIIGRMKGVYYHTLDTVLKMLSEFSAEHILRIEKCTKNLSDSSLATIYRYSESVLYKKIDIISKLGDDFLERIETQGNNLLMNVEKYSTLLSIDNIEKIAQHPACIEKILQLSEDDINILSERCKYISPEALVQIEALSVNGIRTMNDLVPSLNKIDRYCRLLCPSVIKMIDQFPELIEKFLQNGEDYIRNFDEICKKHLQKEKSRSQYSNKTFYLLENKYKDRKFALGEKYNEYTQLILIHDISVLNDTTFISFGTLNTVDPSQRKEVENMLSSRYQPRKS